MRYFILGLSSNKIASETGTDKRRILRVLNTTREDMIRDIPEVIEGAVEVDETYIGGQWKNKRKAEKAQETKRGRGTRKQPVFGVPCRNGYVWAELVPNVEADSSGGSRQADTLLSLIRNRVRRSSVVYSDTWKGYTGVASGGYVHRLVEHGKGAFPDKKGSHINGMEGFWGYLKRNLAAN